ncbi:MAG: hypothetical protein IJX99_02080 [Clostridia bacterium]|nr:hypothetical protein [Clostridia bacterium]
MLKINHDIDLKELAKKYDFIYCSNWREPYEDDNYGDLVYKDSLYINWREDILLPRGAITVRQYGDIDEAIDKLYELIQAGLVEKVEE